MDYETLQREKPSGAWESAQGLNIERLTPFLEQSEKAAVRGQRYPRRGFGIHAWVSWEGVYQVLVPFLPLTHHEPIKAKLEPRAMGVSCLKVPPDTWQRTHYRTPQCALRGLPELREGLAVTPHQGGPRLREWGQVMSPSS